VITRNPHPSPTVITFNPNYTPPLIDLSVDEENAAAERTSDSHQPSTSNSVQKPAAKKRKAEHSPSFDQPEVKKSKRRVRPHESEFSKRASTFKIRNLKKCADPGDFLVSIYKKVKDVLSQEVLDKKCIKAVIILNCKMRKPNDEGETIMTNFKTVATPIFRASDLDGIVNDMFEKVVLEYV
jgi:hypothetical protein